VTVLKNEKCMEGARCWWLTPEILAIQEVEIRRITVRSQPRQDHETLSRKHPSQKRLAEWLKMKALSSSLSITKKTNKTIYIYIYGTVTKLSCFRHTSFSSDFGKINTDCFLPEWLTCENSQ
jgi:hypothetical protein